MTKEEVKEIFDHNWTKLVNPDYSDDDLAEAQNWVIETLSAELQGFEAYLKQYLGENDQMIIGKNVYEEMKYELETLKKTAEPQTEWIPVKDRLPDKSDEYDVTLADKNGERFVDRDYFYETQGCFKSGTFNEAFGYEIIAWKPVSEPSPYKGE